MKVSSRLNIRLIGNVFCPIRLHVIFVDWTAYVVEGEVNVSDCFSQHFFGYIAAFGFIFLSFGLVFDLYGRKNNKTSIEQYNSLTLGSTC